MNDVHYSSKTPEWGTPRPLFDRLNAEFGFTLDPCSTPENATCARYFTQEDDGLSQTWNGRVYMNPPYGYGIGKWVQKAYESAQDGAVVVALVPAKTETRWFHDYVMKASEIRFIKGRLHFDGPNQTGHNAPFASMVVVFRLGNHDPVFSVMSRD